jgi:DNA repair exonuclease SbcCD ATPase subunit
VIPVRVNLRDFLCYDHAADGAALTFDFEGSRLWSITGDNGAGKSAIFDAIRYALYGQHRDGSQRDGRLIRRGAQSCEISFEFRVHESLYRVRRTVGRARGKSVIEPKEYQAARFDESQKAWVPIPGTEKQQGLDEWVKERIGLEYETFIASVLLLQGESDKLTQAASKDRFAVLSGLLSLDAYERLADAAKERARAYRGQADQIEASLASSPSVRAEDLEAASLASAKSEEVMAEAQDAVVFAATVLADATSYAEVRAALTELETSLAAVNAVLVRAAEIRSRHAEWASLSASLPRTRQGLSAVLRAGAAEAEITKVAAQARKIDLPSVEKVLVEQEKIEQEAAGASAAAVLALETVALELEALAPRLALLARHKSGTERIVNLIENLRALDLQLASASVVEERYVIASRMREALPFIKATLASRASAKELQTEITTARKGLGGVAALEGTLAAARIEREALPMIKAIRDSRLAVETRKAVLAKLGAVDHWKAAAAAADERTAAAVVALRLADEESAAATRALTRAEQQHDDARNLLKMRQEAKDEKLCSRCGQKVSPAHAKVELADAKVHVTEAASLVALKKKTEAEASRGLSSARDELDVARREVVAVRLALSKADAATNELNLAETQLSQILETCAKAPSAVKTRVREAAIDKPDLSLTASEGTVRGIPELEKRLQALQHEQGRVAALENRLAREQGALERFWDGSGDAAKLPAATQEIVRAATDAKPRLTVAAIELRVKELVGIERERDGLRTTAGRRASVEGDLQRERDALLELEAELPADERQRVGEQQARLEQVRAARRIARTYAETELQLAQRQLVAARERRDAATRRHADLESAALESRQLATAERAAAALRLEGIATALRESVLRGEDRLLKDAEARLSALASAVTENDQLMAAEGREATLKGKADAVSHQLAKIPENHRITVADSKARQLEAAARRSAAQQARDDARTHLKQLTVAIEQRKESEADYGRLRKRGILYQRLSDLLGRKGLQAVLMDEAIAAIARLANETLGHISGGQQQVRLERVTSARGEDIKIQALDLGSTDEPLDVAFLSGSQKFRVSVALAAGIGQYAAGAGQIRALIIDEGFGSLDAQGRQEMVEELRSLSELLDRVIVVSHQEDFQDRTLFPTGYVLRKSNQRTEIDRIV